MSLEGGLGSCPREYLCCKSVVVEGRKIEHSGGDCASLGV